MKEQHMDIGDLAMYGPCSVRISGVRLRGIAAPHYRFTCTNDDHDHPARWGDLTSHLLLRPITTEEEK